MEDALRDGGFFPEKESSEKEAKEDEPILLPVSLDKRCKYCSQIPLDDEIKKTFGISVCRPCRYDVLKFVTKTSCLSDYLLTGDELKEFRFLERPNPHKGTWSNMHLYLQEEIEEFAVRKWGSLEKIEEMKRRRKKETDDRKIRRLRKRVKALRRRTRMDIRSDERHVHVFKVDGDVSRCECGMSVEQEEL
ncbi:Rad14-like DNA excision repair protein [Encephalitozoon hellem ATCC 50504]|uniref:DNA repair protein RAD14 n=1 Tax=Encephalitozoon hellem TaxID=27973 RepID=A0A9Q9F942_ENCHE|nr:Rad14-like DNA excision repair protein [Encephalitozoon hellem ATCC 50504]AFM99211.1 Rad14-like DNA excision repair protein [Encephalitozoon hellem ATCC 50504]UTX44198.1 DNA repair protein RAD14 [Encephalitozoon hellem]WEL39689.1 DNA repair protein RAD14 [Encephalitozoon hellem]|eukprot:XP_003888192.1 Rad14-like DNA excision repair protein [Encephalitozoon hellem ATCC 50504]